MVDAGNGGVSDNKTLHYTGSNPVLTTCFGWRLLLIHRNLHNGESVELDFYSVYIKKNSYICNVNENIEDLRMRQMLRQIYQ